MKISFLIHENEEITFHDLICAFIVSHFFLTFKTKRKKSTKKENQQKIGNET